MDDRQLDLTEAQKAVKSKYPPINKKYECKCDVRLFKVGQRHHPRQSKMAAVHVNMSKNHRTCDLCCRLCVSVTR